MKPWEMKIALDSEQKTRVPGGKPNIQHQSINLKLFKMLTMIETARSYSRRVALHNTANPPGSAMHALSPAGGSFLLG